MNLLTWLDSLSPAFWRGYGRGLALALTLAVGLGLGWSAGNAWTGDRVSHDCGVEMLEQAQYWRNETKALRGELEQCRAAHIKEIMGRK